MAQVVGSPCLGRRRRSRSGAKSTGETNLGGQVVESEWLTDTDVASLLRVVEEGDDCDPRRLRLFSCACCRRVWHLLSLDAARRIVELAEVYADGEVEEVALQAADDSADFVDFQARMCYPTEAGPQLSKLTHNAIQAARVLASPEFSRWNAIGISQAVAGDPDTDFYFDRHNGGADVLPGDRELAEHAKILRDIFGNPFHHVSIGPNWLTWNDCTIPRLAQSAYNDQILPSGHLDSSRLTLLAEALEDAGCENEDILSHCRSEGPHVRGCWVLDLLLSKPT